MLIVFEHWKVFHTDSEFYYYVCMCNVWCKGRFFLSWTFQNCVNLDCNHCEPFTEFVCVWIHEACPYHTFFVFADAHIAVQNKINERRGLQLVKG
jgi:hypothetical protein